MSTENPLPTLISYHQAKREKVAAAIAAWQADDDGGPTSLYGDAEALVDHLLEEGLLVLPRAVTYGRWRVLVNGYPAPAPGKLSPAGAIDAELAAEMFLLEASKAEAVDRRREITIRPAMDAELVGAAVFGDERLVDGPNGGA